MQLDRDAPARIAAAAATPHERLAGGLGDVCMDAGRGVDDLFARWRDRIAGGDATRFRRRLRGEGWTMDAARAVLAPAPVRPGDPLPAWAVAVGDAVARASEVDVQADRALADGAAGRFDEILLPFVAVARARVNAAPHSALMRRSARAALERALLRRLGADFEPALRVELEAFAAVRGTSPGEARPAFAAHLRDGGLARLLIRLPVLARLAGARVANAADATAELLRRLAADRALIRRAFAAGGAIGRVGGVEAGLSDPHRGGRTVCVLRFDRGLRVVYKPRPLAVDAAWQALLRWLAARGAGPALRPLAVLDRGEYGWMEHAAAAPCRGPGEAASFNERGGALLCLAYALGGGDFHGDNVVARGAHPLLVDVEVLFGAAGGRRGGAQGAHRQSVLHTGLLPQWVPGPAGRVRRQGGLIEPGPIVGGSAPAIPPDQREAATRRPPGDARRVARGFTRMYRALLRHRAELLAADGPLAAFDGAEVRVVPRATWVYDVLLHRLRHPACLSGGAAHFIEADTLCRAWLAAPFTPAAAWRSLASERAALAAGDIPIFTARIALPGASAEARGSAPAGTASADAPAHRVGALSEADLRVQRRLILLAYTGRAARRSTASAAAATGAPTVAEAWDRPLAPVPIIPRPKPVWARAADADRDPSPVCFADEALAIAEGLLRSAIRLPGGGVTWLAPASGRGPARFAPAGPALAHGSTGIALFLAACAAAGGGTRYRTAALRALRPLILDLGETGAAARLAATIGIGGAAGVGGIVYALARIGTLLGDDGPITAAATAARGIDAGGKQGRALDLYSGAAGAVLGLLALHHAGGCADALERAAEIGRHLAPAADSVRGRGFAHGAPGIAHALLHLHRATGDAEFRAAAARAFAAPEPGARRGESPTAWCSGAAGVGLGRAAALDASSTAAPAASPRALARFASLPVGVAVASAAFPSPVGAADGVLDAAIGAVRTAPLDPLDHPCCGNAGMVELLLVAAERTGRAELRNAAMQRASGVVRRARLRRSYGTGIEDRYTPGFLQGAAGIGYTLLRTADPHLPCALLWE